MANNSKLPYILTTATLYSQDFEVTLISAFVLSSLQEQRDKKGFFHSQTGTFSPAMETLPQRAADSAPLNMIGDRRFITVCTMACLGSGRLCARGVEKLCQIGQKTQVRRKPSAAFVRIKEIGIQPLSRTLVQHCQVSLF